MAVLCSCSTIIQSEQEERVQIAANGKGVRFDVYAEGSDSFTNELENEVKKARDHIQWRTEYMTFLEQLEKERKEGRAEGLEEGRAEERVNTEREKARADAAESRADAAESRTKELEKEIFEMKKQLASLMQGQS